MPLKNVHINSINIASLLLLLLPFFLLTGPFLSDLSLVIISLIFLYNTFSSKDYSYFQNSFFFIFISLYCFFIATSSLNVLSYYVVYPFILTSAKTRNGWSYKYYQLRHNDHKDGNQLVCLPPYI